MSTKRNRHIQDVPACLRDIYDIKEILNATDAEADTALDNLDFVLAGMNFSTMLEEDVARWERYLELDPNYTKYYEADLDARRARLAAYAALTPPYTAAKLKIFFDRYLMGRSYFFAVSGDEFIFRGQLDETYWAWLDITKILHKVLPANLVLTVKSGYVTHQELTGWDQQLPMITNADLQGKTHKAVFEYGRGVLDG